MLTAVTAERLAALIIGDDRGWREWADASPDRLIRAARSHGVLPLIAERAADPRVACPSRLREALQAEARTELTADLLQEHELRSVVGAFKRAAVPVLMMKGADLAYSCYGRSDLRPRSDSDLLVRPSNRQDAGAVLESLGYERVPQSGGDLLMYQEPFRLRRGDVDLHVVDLHWRVMNPQRFGASFDFDELFSSAENRPRLAPDARGIDRVHALLLACVHRVAHHFDNDRLIWIHDLHVLAAEMTADAWRTFTQLAEKRTVQGACLRSLEAAIETFRTPVPAEILIDLKQGSRSERGNELFLASGKRHAERVLSDLRGVGSWRNRGRLLRQHLFPSARYMRDVYAPSSVAPLWFLYLRRILRGSRRWLSRS